MIQNDSSLLHVYDLAVDNKPALSYPALFSPGVHYATDTHERGHAVVEALLYKPEAAGSIPDGDIGIFH